MLSWVLPVEVPLGIIFYLTPSDAQDNNNNTTNNNSRARCLAGWSGPAVTPVLLPHTQGNNNTSLPLLLHHGSLSSRGILSRLGCHHPGNRHVPRTPRNHRPRNAGGNSNRPIQRGVT
ncbi:hypothetical protein Pcinc_041109 [Petrolisthes cinctipes]|uniref:Secreted protein n=1 Tax=Petrolisthes cinctipes TaxID=88211 RepID=A0AAE1EIR4_PETCI|nr:hypothetical protein Pcinc_041109 [Petrolisthes cinctipes]